MNTKNTITIYQSSPPRRGEAKCAAGFTQGFTINPGDIKALARAVEFDNCPACYGDTADKAHEAFSKEAAKCEPLMDDGELTSIWNSAILFYHMITTQHGV